jgi:hypothetical protein
VEPCEAAADGPGKWRTRQDESGHRYVIVAALNFETLLKEKATGLLTSFGEVLANDRC